MNVPTSGRFDILNGYINYSKTWRCCPYCFMNDCFYKLNKRSMNSWIHIYIFPSSCWQIIFFLDIQIYIGMNSAFQYLHFRIRANGVWWIKILVTFHSDFAVTPNPSIPSILNGCRRFVGFGRDFSALRPVKYRIPPLLRVCYNRC